MENEILKLSHGFFLENKGIVLGTIIFGIICSTVESIIIPNTVAGTFNSLGNNIDPSKNPEFKKKLLLLVFSWISIKLAYAVSNYFRKKVEPAITQYITVELIKMVFKKYEIENELANAAVVINKVTVIKKNLQDLFYIFCSVFIPRLIVIIFSCVNFYIINNKIGIIIFVCLIIQFFIIVSGLTTCIDITFEEQGNKDQVYDYIEDIFYNISTLQSTPNAFENEIRELRKITIFSK
jgi:ABC-type multidrug transport system fused ATPase/permease subunit